MTPLQLAKAHCANCQTDGKCVGMDFDNQGTHKAFRSKGDCWLADPIKRCLYFEECVIPMSSSDWPGLKTAKEHADFDEGVKEYRRSVMIPDNRERICPKCQIRALEPFKRMCYICREDAEKEARRERNARFRGITGLTETQS